MIFRRGGNTYQIKSTAINSLGIAFRTRRGAVQRSAERHVLRDRRFPLEGNPERRDEHGCSGTSRLTLQVTMTDKGEPG